MTISFYKNTAIAVRELLRFSEIDIVKSLVLLRNNTFVSLPREANLSPS
jgi:hypothetical protein